MAVQINTVNEKYFSLNGVKYAKIYQPLKQGLYSVAIYNQYDTRQQILGSTRFNEFLVDGNSFQNQGDLITALLPVILSSQGGTVGGNSPTGLERIDEGNGNGWRLKGKPVNNYGNIGLNATDVSQSNEESLVKGAIGENSFACGLNTISSGSTSMVGGKETEAHQEGGVALGIQAVSRAKAEVAIGYTNTDYTPNLELINHSDNRIFTVGIGNANGLVVYGNGAVTAEAMSVAEINQRGDSALITKEYADLRFSGLESINEDNGIGWRLAGRDGDKYGNIGLNAVDLSTSEFNSSVNGATGTAAIAMGVNTVASGDTSFSIGNQTIAGGIQSYAEGNNTIASGQNSHAQGDNTSAIGFGSFSSGINTTARSYGETSIGVFPTDSPAFSDLFYNQNDKIFNVGNGPDISNRSDAFTILKNGLVSAPSLTNSMIDGGDGQVLITKGYFEAYNVSGSTSGSSQSLVHQFACSDENSELASSIEPVFTDFMAFDMTMNELMVCVNEAPTDDYLEVDLHKNGSSVFNILPRIDQSENTTLTASVQQVLKGVTTFVKGDKIEMYITNVGSSYAGSGLKCKMIQ